MNEQRCKQSHYYHVLTSELGATFKKVVVLVGADHKVLTVLLFCLESHVMEKYLITSKIKKFPIIPPRL